MKIYIWLIALTSIVFGGTYEDNFLVDDVNISIENHNTLMSGDFKEILRFDEIIFEDKDMSDNSKESLKAITKAVDKYRLDDEEFIVSIIGHTNQTTDNEAERLVKSQSYGSKVADYFSYTLDRKASSELSSDYASKVALELELNGLKSNLMVVEYRAGEDGLYVAEADLSNRVMVAIYVEVDRDKDRDGVIDKLDECPDTPRGIAVDEVGCPLDRDEDTIADYLDKCPDTIKHLTVDEVGCHHSIKLLINYNRDSYVIDDSYLVEIKKFAKFMQDNNIYTAEIFGHTDSRSTERYNDTLSQNRANSVKEALIKEGIDEAILTIYSFGEREPVETNDTDEGRGFNRRVEVELLRIVEKKEGENE